MRLTTVLSALLSANAVVASPFIEPRREQLTAKQQPPTVKHSHPPYDISSADTYGSGSKGVNAGYTHNWAGAVLRGNGFQSVTGIALVPTPVPAPGGNDGNLYVAAAWVGINGTGYSSAILQTGIDFWFMDGQPVFTAWSEWPPNLPCNFDNFAMSVGELTKMTVTANSTTSDITTFENIHTSQIISHSFNSELSDLCEANVEWIIEDFMVDGSAVFISSSVTTTSGATWGVDGATILEYGAKQPGFDILFHHKRLFCHL